MRRDWLHIPSRPNLRYGPLIDALLHVIGEDRGCLVLVLWSLIFALKIYHPIAYLLGILVQNLLIIFVVDNDLLNFLSVLLLFIIFAIRRMVMLLVILHFCIHNFLMSIIFQSLQ